MAPFNGVGVFGLDFNWPNEAANGIPITASRVQAEDQNIADGLSNVICRDGQSTTTAAIPFAAGITSTTYVGTSYLKSAQVFQTAANKFVSMAGFSPAGTASTTGAMLGLGSSFALTPITNGTGHIRVTITGWGSVSAAGATAQLGLRYGTGAAPTFGSPITGTSVFASQDILLTATTSGSPAIPFTIFAEFGPLVAATPYWFDIPVTILGGLGGTSTNRISSVSIEEI